MFIKNNSKYQVGIKTKKRVLYMVPNSVQMIPDYEIIELSDKLTEISEEEFNEFNNANKNENKDISKDEVVVSNTEDVLSAVDNSKPIDEQSNKKQDSEEAKKTKRQYKNDKQSKNSKSVDKQKNTKENIEQRIEQLKQEWVQATSAKVKETIAKQIKSLQNKIK